MNKSSKYSVFKLGYVFFPFLSFLLVLKEYRASWFKNALWLFIVFFGFSMSFIETIDAYSYKIVFEDYAKFRSYGSFLDVFDSTKTGKMDFANSLINFVLALFTDNYHFLFGTYAVIFGYFYSRNIDFVLKQITTEKARLAIGLVVFLSFYIGFWNINGFRFWTACHIFVFGLINYIYREKKVKGTIFIIVSSAFHLSFLLPIIMFLVYKYIPRYNKFFILITLAFTLYNPLSNLTVVETYLSKYAFNEQVKDKVKVYTSEEIVDKAKNTSANTDLFKVSVSFFTKGAILALAWLLLSKFNILKETEIRMLNFGVILTLAGTVLSFVPSVGIRFSNVGLFILLYAVVFILMKYSFFPLKRKLMSKVGYLCSALLILTNIWILFTFSIHTVIGNYFTIFFDTNHVFYSLGDLLVDSLK